MAWVSPTAPELRRSPGERALAWVFSGPLGHLYSVVIDVAVFALRTLAAHLGQRLRQGLTLSGEGSARNADR